MFLLMLRREMCITRVVTTMTDEDGWLAYYFHYSYQ